MLRLLYFFSSLIDGRNSRPVFPNGSRIAEKNIITKRLYFNKKVVLSLLYLFFVHTGTVRGQKAEIIRGNQQWLQYYNQVKLNENWIWLNDGGYRWKDGFHQRSQYILRTAIRYLIQPDIQVSAGFAHLGFYSSDDLMKVEFRPYQEIAVRNSINKIRLNHRYRIEERIFNPVIDGHLRPSEYFNFRFRYAFTVTFPLFELSKKMPDRKLFLEIGDEICFNAGKGIAYNVFDQNRFTLGPSIQLGKKLALSVLWNSQFSDTSIQGKYKYNNVFWLKIKHKLNVNRQKRTKDNSSQ